MADRVVCRIWNFSRRSCSLHIHRGKFFGPPRPAHRGENAMHSRPGKYFIPLPLLSQPFFPAYSYLMTEWGAVGLGENLPPPSQKHPASRHLWLKLNRSSWFEETIGPPSRCFFRFIILSRRFFFPFFVGIIEFRKKFHRVAIGRCFLEEYKIFLSRRIVSENLFFFWFFNLSLLDKNSRKNRSEIEE